MTDHDQLLGSARTARAHAHVPYSGFDAGAAVATASGAVTVGAVVENISLGLAMCAERVALFAATAQGEVPTVLALVAPATARGLTLPCGACLQVALELGGPELVIVAEDADQTIRERHTVADLLPSGPHQPKARRRP